MKMKLDFKAMVSYTLLLAMTLAMVPSPIFAASFSSDESNYQVENGADFEIKIMATDLEDASSVGFEMNFDSSVLSFDSMEVSDFYKTGSMTVLPVATVASPGLLRVSIGRLPQTGVTGSGEVATLTMHADANGDSELTFSDASVCHPDFTCDNVDFPNASVTVSTADTVAPIITVLGDNPYEVTVGDTYNDPGATSTDDVDGDITAQIVVDTTDVDTDTVGSYTVTYNVSDAAGNAATEATRTVNVTEAADTTAPVISNVSVVTTINTATVTWETDENADSRVEYGSDTNYGSVESDNNLNTSHSITINNLESGTIYHYMISSSDEAGNEATSSDETFVTLNPTSLTLDQSSYSVDTGVDFDIVLSAQDLDDAKTVGFELNYDNNVVSYKSIQVSSFFTSNGSVFVIPAVTEVSPGVTSISLGRLLGAGLSGDGEIATITMHSEAEGSTDLDFTNGVVIKSDSSENSSTWESSSVVVTAAPDTTAPVITLVGDNPVDLTVGDTYSEAGATASDDVDGDISAQIVVDNSSVDTSTAGSYTVTYNVSDAAGNNANEITRTVNVSELADTTAPIITLVGDNPVELNVGDTYTEVGATATDNVDGDITSSVVINNSSVDTNTAGSYTVTYNVSDAAGNAATEVTRTVNVSAVVVPPPVDTIAPVITLLGENPVELNVGDTYSEAGATATDNVDGDLSAQVIIDNTSVDTSTAGSYTVTYNVNDAAGNAATEVTRTVNVTEVVVAPPVDTTAPVITLVGDNPVELKVGDTYSEAGATATDNVDGDLSSSVVVDNTTVDTNTVGSYTVTYNVSDAAGNDAIEVTRTVNVTEDDAVTPPVDTTAPVIILQGENPVELKVGDIYTESGATATDNVDGDISAQIVVNNSSVDTSTVGSYTVTYNVSDAAGNDATEVTRTVNVTEDDTGRPPSDTTAPVITLVGDNPVELNVGDTYTEAGATASDDVDGDISAQIVVENSSIDTNTAGTYTVTYSVSDAAGNNATEVTRTVNVTEVVVTPPTTETKTSTPPAASFVPRLHNSEKEKEKDEKQHVEGQNKETGGSDDDINSNKNYSDFVEEEATVLYEYNEFTPLTQEEVAIYDKTVAKSAEELEMQARYAIAKFLHDGTNSTKRLGSGERAGVLNSYFKAFGKLPQSASEWMDVINIANQRMPEERNKEREEMVKSDYFEVVTGRKPNMDDSSDSMAVAMMTYGLRPTSRNMEQEKKATELFQKKFKRLPKECIDWDVVRAIAYSGVNF